MALRFYRCLNSIRKFSTNFSYVPTNYIRGNKQGNFAIPCTIGFSVFTWLGFADPKLTAEDELIKTLKYSILFIQKSEFVKAEQLLHIALRQAQQIQHELGITYVYDVMANLALEREQLDKAKKLFVAVSQRLMSDGATEDDSRIIHISIKLARISHLQKEFEVAQLGYDWCINKLKKELEHEPHDGTMKMLALAEDWYGRLFLDTRQYEHSYNLMKSAFEHMKEVSNIESEQLVLQMNDLGTVCQSMGNLDESLSYFKDAIELGKKINYEDIAVMYVNLGRAYLSKKMIAEARKSCGYAWKLGRTQNKPEIENEAHLCLKQVQSMS